MVNMSQIGLNVINMSQYYGLEVLKYMRMIYNLHIKLPYITYKSLYSKQMFTISINMKGLQEH